MSLVFMRGSLSGWCFEMLAISGSVVNASLHLSV